MTRVTLPTILVLGLLNLGLFGSLETASAQTVSIAILNFQDDTGANAAADLGRKLAQELHQRVATGYKDLLPRLVTSSSDSVKRLTLDQIAALAKQSGAAYVVRGGLLTLSAEPAGSDSKVTAQLYADIVSADSGAIITTVRAEGSGTQSGAAAQLSSLDLKSDQFSSSGVGQAFAGAIAQLADSIHQAVTGGVGNGSTAGKNTLTTTTNQPDTSQAAAQVDAAKSVEADTDLQQLITQAEMLLSSSSDPNSQTATAASEALQALKSALEAKATLMQNGKDTSQADQDIATRRQALQTAVAQLTAEAAAASSSGAVTINTQQSTNQKKNFIQTISDFAGQALSILQNIQQMRTALQSLNESSANPSTIQNGNTGGAGNTSATEQQLGECNGVVTDQNGTPIPNAQVADQTSGASTSTDNNGQYDLKGLLASQIAMLTVTANAKTMTAQTPITPGQTATLDFQFKPDAVGGRHPIILPPTIIVNSPPGSKVGALKGVVRDPQGRPVARALVMLKGLAIARTDSQGQYQFLNAPAGTRQLSVNKSGLQTITTQVKVAAAKSTDAPVQFAASDRIALPIKTSLLVSASGGTVAGSVVDRQNHPLAGAKISLIQQTSGLAVFTGPTGAFVMNNIKPGQYHIIASKAGYDPSFQNVTLSSSVRESVQFRLNEQSSPAVAGLLKTRITRRATIRGRVLGANGNAIANATVALKLIAGNAVLTSINTNHNGEYQLSVEPGKYEVRASSNSYQAASHVLEAQAGATTQSDFALERLASDTVNSSKKPPTTIERPGVVGDLVGQVTDANTRHPVAGAMVSISQQRTQTDQTGKFAFANLSPGKYQLTISKPGYSPIQGSISIESGKTAHANLTLQPKSTEPSEIRRSNIR
ncbi:MAG TPA: carboxypeptidase regulatory-like domain-containing protein [Blastocatellia bacterium]|nr:carboxypeptidase regulatory-like domain-containing protein [Blastocatellia bacterium]